MGHSKGSAYKPRNTVKDVYVARTVQESDTRFAGFLERAGRHLGRNAIIHTIEETHVTLMESCGVAQHFRSQGYTPHDIRAFKGLMERRLADAFPDRAAMPARIDPARPLRWMPGRNNTLAMRVLLDERLLAERAEIESCLEEQFGELPKLRPLEPHIAIGRLRRQPAPEEWENPRVLLPDWLKIPEAVALNGLAVHLDKIK